ncbi:hypothetical protein NL676_033514 [Syzygium grande]|nr:hypothetical protein NL676_033514 [Syzygium grande]
MEESNPMSPEPRKIQGSSNPAERPPEVRIDINSKDMVTDPASQDGRKTTKEVHEKRTSKGIATDKTSQDGCKTTREIYKEGSSEGMATDKTSEDGHKTTGEVHEKGSSEGMASDKAPQDDRKRTRDVHGEESSEGMATPWEDFQTLLDQKFVKLQSKVKPKAKVDEKYRLLFEAVLKGDWKTTEKKLNGDLAAMTAKVMVTESDDFTVLDVAIMAAQDELVENLVKRFPPNYKDLNGTALRYAARGGRIRIVKALGDKVDAEPIIADALEFAARFAPMQEEVIWYLARRTTSFPSHFAMLNLIMGGHSDILLYLARKHCRAAVTEIGDLAFLDFLAVMTRYFRSGARLNFWERAIYNFIPLCLVDTSRIDSKDTKMAQALNRFKKLLWNLATIPAPFIKRSGELKFKHNCSLDLAKLALTTIKDRMSTPKILKSLLNLDIVLEAASRGLYEIVDLYLTNFPELMWDIDFSKKLIKEVVKGRHVDLFRLVNAHNPIQYLDDIFSMNFDLMEAVTKWSSRCVPPDVSGAAFLMQRELQWFQVVEVSSFPSIKWLKFLEHRKSYWEVFVEQRKDLFKEAGQWMKDTSSSCSLVATLIITVAFAAAFTVPGGNSGSTGIPIFMRKSSFMVFAIADALALFSSITATLTFLIILTSRYTIEDFICSLQRKMILGLTFLFLSLAFMLVAFGSALTIVLGEQFKWIYIPITLLAAFPVVLFAILQLPLYIEMVESTYRPRLYRPMKL